MTRGGVVPWGRNRNWVCEIAVTCAIAVCMLAFGLKKTFTTAIPLSDCDSMWSMSFTSVVKARSVVVVIRFAISCGARPWKFQTMLITGMSMSGKMSVGVRKITMGLRMSNTRAITMNV